MAPKSPGLCFSFRQKHENALPDMVTSFPVCPSWATRTKRGAQVPTATPRDPMASFSGHPHMKLKEITTVFGTETVEQLRTRTTWTSPAAEPKSWSSGKRYRHADGSNGWQLSPAPQDHGEGSEGIIAVGQSAQPLPESRLRAEQLKNTLFRLPSQNVVAYSQFLLRHVRTITMSSGRLMVQSKKKSLYNRADVVPGRLLQNAAAGT